MTRFIVADVMDGLRELPDESVQMIVTSPPYWRLRNYGVDGELGQEPTIAEYVSNLVGVFDECRRVLKMDGTLWLNLGDTYASNWPCNRRNVVGAGSLANGKREARPDRLSGLKNKDLCGIPWRVALALQDDGWWLRRDIIWSKPNPMPESAQDRPTSAHEYIFLLTKSERYFYDAAAIAEEPAQSSQDRAYLGKRPHSKRQNAIVANGIHGESDSLRVYDRASRNKRSVWTVSTTPYSGAHFATFPPKLIEPCIQAGSRPGDTVLDPFVGSGTTLVVAAKLGRHGIGIDIDARNEALFNERMRGITPALEGIA